MNKLPIIDISSYLAGDSDDSTPSNLINALEEYGAFIMYDPRVSIRDNDDFLNMMESYFIKDEEQKQKDCFPNLMYQVGYTPPNTEKPRDHSELIEKFDLENKPAKPISKDAKSRYYWRVGESPKNTRFPVLNSENRIPEGFLNWKSTMDSWGGKMLQAATTVAELISLAYNFEKNTIAALMNDAPHLLDPTGIDFNKFHELGTICAGFHYDLNLLTVHGKPRFAGLDIWTRSNVKIPADLPDGCLLVQAGKQLEYITGGRILAGYHQVVINQKTHADIQRAFNENRPACRVSSTFFAHIASDNVMKSLFADSNPSHYKEILAGDFVINELKEIGLYKKSQQAMVEKNLVGN